MIDNVTDIPKLPEITATLVSGIFAPEQFTRHLMIQSDHVSFDELGIGFQETNRIVGNQVQIRQEQLGGQVTQRLLHRSAKTGRTMNVLNVSVGGKGIVSGML